MAFTHTWQELLIVRIFFGYGIGLKGATVAIYSAEVAPTVIRGALVMGWQLWTTVGIVLGFGKLVDVHCWRSAANAIVRNSGAITWRLQIGSSFIPAVPLAVLCFFGPESPRWYMRKGRMAEAFVSMGKLRNHPILASRDLYYAWVQWEAELKVSAAV
jgi:MFS family permease